MPFIQICVPMKLSDDTKTQLIQEVIDRTHEAVGSDELPHTNMSVAGQIHAR